MLEKECNQTLPMVLLTRKQLFNFVCQSVFRVISQTAWQIACVTEIKLGSVMFQKNIKCFFNLNSGAGRLRRSNGVAACLKRCKGSIAPELPATSYQLP